MSLTSYGIAILGAGMGSGSGAAHLAALRSLPRQYQVVRVFDPDPEQAEAMAATCDAQGASDIGAVLDDPAVAIVDICLPPDLHVPVTLQALAAGKHVICAPPITASLADMDRIEQAASTAGRHLFPVFPDRYGNAVRTVESLIKAGMLGALRTATLESHGIRTSDRPLGSLPHGADDAVLSPAIHMHDLICHIAGPISQVSATTTPATDADTSGDRAAIWMHSAGGALITSSITLGAATDHCRLRLIFEKATIESGTDPDRPSTQTWTFTPRNPADKPRMEAVIDGEMLKPGPRPDGIAGFFTKVAATLNGRGAMDGLADARRSVDLASAIHASARDGRAIALPLPVDHPLYGGCGDEPA